MVRTKAPICAHETLHNGPQPYTGPGLPWHCTEFITGLCAAVRGGAEVPGRTEPKSA